MIARRMLLAAPLLALPALARAQAAPAFDEALVAGGDAGVQLYLRNKRGEGAPRVVLFVHGAVWPGSTSFDLPLVGTSWMDYVAARGFDAWCVDLRGYGRSTRPPALSRDAAAAAPVTRSEEALRDLAATVASLRRERRGVPRVTLVGWGWGAALCARFAAENAAQVERLLLLAPGWSAPAAPGAWRAVTRAEARAAWLAGVPEARRAQVIPAGWFEHWADATFATDPDGSRQVPSVLRVPNGPLADREPLFDAARVATPTLLLAAEWDRESPTEAALAIFARLAGPKRLTLLGETTHMAMLERGRGTLYQAAQIFLEETI
jgi:pimeloyl-ACP methyl ester carboxylesterase